MDRLKEILKWNKKGLNNAKIAILVGIHRSNVSRQLLKNGVQSPLKKYANKRYTTPKNRQ